jgi:hypothetical protein
MPSLLSLFGWIRSHPETGGWIALGSIGLAALYGGILLAAVTRMSPDYFTCPAPPPGTLRRRHPILLLAARGFKTLLGVVMLMAGIAMLVLPGQGLVTIAIAITFLEFPGKRKLLAAIACREGVMRALNAIRRKAGRDPFADPAKHLDGIQHFRVR